MTKRKKMWIVEVYDPQCNVIMWTSEPMSEVQAMDKMIELTDSPSLSEMSVSSRSVD